MVMCHPAFRHNFKSLAHCLGPILSNITKQIESAKSDSPSICLCLFLSEIEVGADAEFKMLACGQASIRLKITPDKVSQMDDAHWHRHSAVYPLGIFFSFFAIFSANYMQTPNESGI